MHRRLAPLHAGKWRNNTWRDLQSPGREIRLLQSGHAGSPPVRTPTYVPRGGKTGHTRNPAKPRWLHCAAPTNRVGAVHSAAARWCADFMATSLTTRAADHGRARRAWQRRERGQQRVAFLTVLRTRGLGTEKTARRFPLQPHTAYCAH